MDTHGATETTTRDDSRTTLAGDRAGSRNQVRPLQFSPSKVPLLYRPQRNAMTEGWGGIIHGQSS